MANKIITINQWNGGIVNDPRDARENVCRISSNFDIFTNPNILTPYRDSESGDSAASTSKKRNFALALRTGTTYSLYALGEVSGSSPVRAEVLYKDLIASGTNTLADNAWATPSNNQQTAATGTTDFNLFVFYRRTGLIYGARTNTGAADDYIWAFDPAGGAWSNSVRQIEHTEINQGLVHSKDDILYIPYYNSAGTAGTRSRIAKLDGTTWTDAALTLPDHLVPRSIAEYGNYLAIGCVPFAQNANAVETGNSVVFLWDRSSTTLTDQSIDWGEGSLQVLEELDGALVGISDIRQAAPYISGRVVCKTYTSGGAIPFADLRGDVRISTPKQKTNSRIYFSGSIQLNGSYRTGVWSIKRNPDGSFAIGHERTPNNDTAIATAGQIKSFIIVGDYTFISFTDTDADTTYTLTKTNDAANFTATSIRETQINPGMKGLDRSLKKRLVSVALTYPPLVAAGQVVLKYKVDGGSDTTIFTETTNSAVITEARIDADGAQFSDGYEYEFRIESTGNAEITSLIYQYELLENIVV